MPTEKPLLQRHSIWMKKLLISERMQWEPKTMVSGQLLCGETPAEDRVGRNEGWMAVTCWAKKKVYDRRFVACQYLSKDLCTV